MDLVEHTLVHLAARPRHELRVAIQWMQDSIARLPNRGSAEDCPVQNIFSPGTYCREITMAEGLLIVGRIHRHAHTNILSKGRCRVLTEFGTEELVAPCIFNSEPGTKRIVYVLEDTVWTTVHANPSNITDVEALLAKLSAPSYSDIEIEGELA